MRILTSLVCISFTAYFLHIEALPKRGHIQVSSSSSSESGEYLSRESHSKSLSESRETTHIGKPSGNAKKRKKKLKKKYHSESESPEHISHKVNHKSKGRSMSLTPSGGVKKQGRGVLSNFVKIHTDLVKDFLAGDPVGAFKHLFTNVGGTAKDAFTKFGEFSGVIQTQVENLVADELNDLVHSTDQPIIYRLFTQKNKKEGQVMHKDGTVFSTNWNKEAKVKVIIHGFSAPYLNGTNDTLNMVGATTIKDAYLNAGVDDNLIVADWTSLSHTLSYIRAAAASRVAGADLASFLHELVFKGNIDNPEDIHLIGYGLGAHVCGTAGYLFQNYTEGDRIGRITGLDPAGTLFDEVFNYKIPVDSRFFVDRSDATFVDIIHCNYGELIKPFKTGLITQAGHADFYPNGGRVQPGCEIFGEHIQVLGCSSARCWELYAASVGQVIYPACRCDNFAVLQKDDKCVPCEIKQPKVYMGDLCAPRTKGIYYLKAAFNASQLDFLFDDHVPPSAPKKANRTPNPNFRFFV